MHWTPRIRRLAGSVPRSSELRQWLDRTSKPRLGLRIKTWYRRYGENSRTVISLIGVGWRAIDAGQNSKRRGANRRRNRSQKARTQGRSRRRGFGENDTTTEKELAEGRRIRRPRCLVFEIGGERAVPAAVRLLLAFQQILILGNQESKRAVAC